MTDITREAVERLARWLGETAEETSAILDPCLHDECSTGSKVLLALRDALDKAEWNRDDWKRSSWAARDLTNRAERERDEARVQRDEHIKKATDWAYAHDEMMRERDEALDALKEVQKIAGVHAGFWNFPQTATESYLLRLLGQIDVLASIFTDEDSRD